MTEFSEEQQKAIHRIKGSLMVLSCAGSGKTTVILERVREILASGAGASEILAVTFSKAAAVEMQERFSKRYRENVHFSTIHSICFSVLSRHLGLKADAILKEHEKRSFLLDERRNLNAMMSNEEKNTGMDDYVRDISAYISRRIASDYMSTTDRNAEEPESFYGKIYEDYCRFKNGNGKCDFDDMITECHRLFTENRSVLEYWQKFARYIMIDEFQDTSLIQAEVFFMLAGPDGNICVVGDDDQCIYSFRGSEPGIFRIFKERYPLAETVILGDNYRCRPRIVERAAHLIGFNKDRLPKQIRAARPDNGPCIHLYQTRFPAKQNDILIRALKEDMQNGGGLSRTGILYRLKKEASELVQLLERNHIPYYTRELPPDIHEGMVYRDIRAYYRLTNGSWQQNDLYRIINRPKRYIQSRLVSGVGLNKELLIEICCRENKDRADQIRAEIERLWDDLCAMNSLKPEEFLNYMKDQMLYRNSLPDYAEYLKQDRDTYTKEFDYLLEECREFSSMEEWHANVRERKKDRLKLLEKNRETGVYLSTFHGAKGLQWNNVYIISANEGITPHIHCGEIENPEEERRLFYVALTRAQEHAHIMFQRGDKNANRIPSRYITEMGFYELSGWLNEGEKEY